MIMSKNLVTLTTKILIVTFTTISMTIVFFDKDTVLIPIYVLLFVSLLLLYISFLNTSMPKPYNVAIVGFPCSGKTTLLTSIFGEIFARRIHGINAHLKGKFTIERVNNDLEKFQKDMALGPTKNEDRFSYQTNITINRFPINEVFKVEFGDFPGKDSEKHFEKNGEQLHNTEFFKWYVDADAIIFVVDIGEYLRKDGDKDYVTKMSKAIRTAWESILDINKDILKEVEKRPIVLVFTKADLFGVTKSRNSIDEFEDTITKLGFGETPKIHEIDLNEFESGKNIITDDFKDLISFLGNQKNKFNILFTSSFGRLNGSRLGFSELLKLVL